MLMVEIEDRLHNLKQGVRSVMDYVAELKSLWADADHCKPIQLPHSNCVAWVKKWIEEKRVIQFLRGLNKEFEARRSSMFHQPTLPSLEEAIAAISQEEFRLKVMNETTSSPPLPMFAATGVENRKCFNCGESGHLICGCPKPLKPYSGRGRGTSRGGGDRGGRGVYRANVATTQEHFSKGSVVSLVELEESKHEKEKCDNSWDQNQEIYSGDFINFAYTDEGETNRETSWECNHGP